MREIEAMPKIACACGCGTLIPPINRSLKPARYVRGHNGAGIATRFQPGRVETPEQKDKRLAASRAAGYRPTEDHRKRAAEGARSRHERQRREGIPYKRGWNLSDETRAKLSDAQRRRDLRGPRNPFYGRTHSEETREKLRRALSGEGNPNWAGGVGTLPYGPEFTKPLKRAIRQRDGHVCQRCGKTQEENGRTLQVHHIDHDKTNNDPSNLATVCNSCNVWCSYHRDEPFAQIAA